MFSLKALTFDLRCYRTWVTWDALVVDKCCEER